MNKLCSFLMVMLASFSSMAQTRYIVYFKDKNQSPYSFANPGQYLSLAALARRQINNVSLDSADLPVNKNYLDAVSALPNVSILNKSKWLNAVSVKISDHSALGFINALPFVRSSESIAAFAAQTPGTPRGKYSPSEDIDGSTARLYNYQYGFGHGQVALTKTDYLHRIGLTGKGLPLAMLDVGYYRYQNLSVFDSMRLEGRVKDTWDFVNNESSVNEDGAHGSECLSMIAANKPGTLVGTAPNCDFYLYRTEDERSEYPVEEFNLVCGLERADSAGAKLLSVSLGYTTFDNPVYDHTYNDLDGKTTIAARGVRLGTRKGLLIFVAAGNDGNAAWHYIATPADADSAVAVAAVDTLGNVGTFSSYGPRADGRIKPDLAATGKGAVMVNTYSGSVAYNNGTSYACPNLAGTAACLWEAFPEANNMDIVKALTGSATKALNPDNRIGYGIPDAKVAFNTLYKKYISTQGFNDGCEIRNSYRLKLSNTSELKVFKRIGNSGSPSLVYQKRGSADSFQNYIISFGDFAGAQPDTMVTYTAKVFFGNNEDSLTIGQDAFRAGHCNTVTMNGVNILQESGVVYLNYNGTDYGRFDCTVVNQLGQKLQQFPIDILNRGLIKLPLIKGLAKGYYYLVLSKDGLLRHTIPFLK